MSVRRSCFEERNKEKKAVMREEQKQKLKERMQTTERDFEEEMPHLYHKINNKKADTEPELVKTPYKPSMKVDLEVTIRLFSKMKTEKNFDHTKMLYPQEIEVEVEKNDEKKSFSLF